MAKKKTSSKASPSKSKSKKSPKSLKRATKPSRQSTMTLNKEVPAFSGVANQGRAVSSSELRGRPYVIYFYPKDDTPGCTLEGQDFARAYEQIKRLGGEVIGVSKDSLQSHDKFCAKYELPFPLVSDENGALCELFGVMKEKNMYGKKYLGIERSTFVIDSNGVLKREWRGVKVAGHVDEVLGELKALS